MCAALLAMMEPLGARKKKGWCVRGGRGEVVKGGDFLDKKERPRGVFPLFIGRVSRRRSAPPSRHYRLLCGTLRETCSVTGLSLRAHSRLGPTGLPASGAESLCTRARWQKGGEARRGDPPSELSTRVTVRRYPHQQRSDTIFAIYR